MRGWREYLSQVKEKSGIEGRQRRGKRGVKNKEEGSNIELNTDGEREGKAVSEKRKKKRRGGSEMEAGNMKRKDNRVDQKDTEREADRSN